MSEEVWKFPLQLGQTFLEMPERAKALAVQMQHGTPTLWALVAPSRFPERREFYLIGTGHPLLRCDLVYLATVQDGAFVWHAFEAPRQ